MAIGGNTGFEWGTGLGLKFAHYRFDIGFKQSGGMFNHAKGFAFSLSQQLIF